MTLQGRALAVAFGLLCRPASAFDIELPWFSESAFDSILWTKFDAHATSHDLAPDNDDYQDLRSVLELRLRADRLRAGLRLDGAFFFATPETAPAYLDRIGLEKASLTWTGDRLQVDLGDFYATFGRGLALSVRKTDLLGEDNTLQGARADLRLDRLELVALSGFLNPVNLDLREKTLTDPYDLISGLRATADLAPGVQVALHGVHALFDPFGRNDQAPNLPSQAFIVGGGLSASGLQSALDLCAEVDWLHRAYETLQDDFSKEGLAAYLSAVLALGDWTVTAEAKSLSDYALGTLTPPGDSHASAAIALLRPPTLEPLSMEVSNNSDVHGGRLALDFRPGGAGTLLSAAYAGFWAFDYNGEPRWIYNLNVGLEQAFLGTGRVRALLGLREEHPDTVGATHAHLVYLEAEGTLPLDQTHSLSLHGTHWQVHELRGVALDSVRGDWTASFHWSPHLSLSAIVGYDTAPSAAEGGSLAAFAGGAEQIFAAGALTAVIGQQTLRLLAGSLRGGLLCADGVCKMLPPFTGLRAELSVQL